MTYKILTYEWIPLVQSVVDSLRPFLAEGERIIWRAPFRWHDDNGVLSNHYESMTLKYLAEDFRYEIVHNFEHVGVVKRKL